MPGVKSIIYVCYSARTTPGVWLYKSLTLEEKYYCVYYSRLRIGW